VLPSTIGGYKVLHALGSGGMGTVFLAEDPTLARRVAVKVVSGKSLQDESGRTRFLREARAMATVEHPNVVHVYSFGESEGRPYIVMEYVEGETLASRIRRVGPLPVAEAVDLVRQAVLALEAAWEKGIVHRDVKPPNILIDKKGRVAALEILVFTTAVANLVREGKTHQIPGMIQVGKKLGNQPLDDAIMDHLRMKRISPEEAYEKSLDKRKFRQFLAHPPEEDEV